MSHRGRRLRDDERALWREVTRSISPLHVGRVEPDAAPSGLAVEPVSPPPPPSRPQPVPRPAAVPAPPALAPLGQKFRRKLVRGAESIDARIDLHGMTQGEAHAALYRFLDRAQTSGARTVLVITGKGLRGDGHERGVLRRQVPHWLGLPDLRRVVLGFEDAHIGHGGEGALYVRIRRMRSHTD